MTFTMMAKHRSGTDEGHDGFFVHQDGQHRLWIDGDGTAHIQGSYFEIRNFDPANYGISRTDTTGTPPDAIVGTSGDDYLTDTAASDVIYAGAGNDRVDAAQGGGDTIYGEDGNDRLQGGSGVDLIYGGIGDDTIQAYEGSDTVFGEAGRDVIIGDLDNTTSGPSTRSLLTAYNGDYAPGADFLYGGDDQDLIAGGASRDVLHGDGGDDFLVGGMGVDLVDGGIGNDLIFGDGYVGLVDSSWSVTLTQNPDNSISLDYTGILEMDEHGDQSGTEDDILKGGDGYDVVYGAYGDDWIDGGEGSDMLSGGEGNDEIHGGGGDDTIFGWNSNSTALDDDDVLFGDAGNDYIEGGVGNDRLEGGIGADTLFGDDGDDLLFGGDDNDQMSGGLGVDEMYGGAGIDTMAGDEGADTLYGGDGDDQVFGNDGDDYLSGELGNDTLVGGAGIDVIDGGDGDDDIWGAEDADTLFGGTGLDNLNGGDADDVISGGFDDDHLWGNAGNDELNGDDGNDFLYGGNGDNTVFTGDDILFGGLGDDELWGEDGFDYLDGGDGADYIEGGLDGDTIIGGSGADTAYGGSGNDTISGDADNDTLWGEDGDDDLTGGTGDDVLVGGLGADTYVFALGDGHDSIYEETADTGVRDADVLQFDSSIAPADLSVYRTGNDLVISHSNGTDSVTVKNWYASTDYRLQQIEFSDGSIWSEADVTAQALTRIVGTAGDDTINGTNDSQTLEGLAGNDVINGWGGVDTFIGGPGDDLLQGPYGDSLYVFNVGDGHDTIAEANGSSYYDAISFGPGIAPTDLSYERVGDDLVISHANGVDGITVTDFYLGTTYQIDEVLFQDYPTETLTTAQIADLGTNVDHAYTFNIGDGAVSIQEWGGNDTVTFGAGIDADTLAVERVGNDLSFTVPNTSDVLTITDWFNGPDQQVEIFLFDDGRSWTSDSLTQQFLHLVGTAGDDTLSGGDYYAEQLDGLAGNDLLQGYGNADTLNGGSGDDTLEGGDGSDLLNGGTGNDTLYGGYGYDIYDFNAGDGSDVIYDGLDFGTVRFGSGLPPQDHIYTQNGSDLIITFAGTSDQLTLKNYYYDTSKWGFQYVQEGTAGDDVLTGSDPDAGYLAGNDVMYGYGGNDTLESVGFGSDYLYGGDDSDTLLGGEGSDHLYGEGGNDYLYGMGNYTNYDGTDYLYGGDGVDYLDGGLGTDYLYGGAGNDILGGDPQTLDQADVNGNVYNGGIDDDLLRGGGGLDRYNFNLGDGHDTIEEHVYDLGNGELRYSMHDLLVFGEGITPDSVTVSRDNYDLILEISASDSVTISNWFINGGFRLQVEEVDFADGTTWTNDDLTRLALTQYGTEGADTLVGTAGWADTLYGLGGDDILTGDTGDDVLDGGTGNDILEGGYNDDTYVFGLGYGEDTIIDNEGVNQVTFGTGISATDITYERTGNDLVLSVNGTTDRLTVKDFLIDPAVRQMSFVFDDGTQLPSNDQMADDLINLEGTSGDDTLIGTTGFDRIYGYDGNDVLDSGAGADTLDGGLGDDTYVAGPDGVVDTIVDAGGANTLHYDSMALSDLTQLSVEWTETGHKLSIDGFYITDGLDVVSQVEFTDGTYSFDQVVQDYTSRNGPIVQEYGGLAAGTMEGTEGADEMYGGSASYYYYTPYSLTMNGNGGNDWIQGGTAADVINGGDGDDTLMGYLEGDVLDGGAGNDTLYGGTPDYTYPDGDDTYRFGLGDGTDTVVDYGGTDTLEFLGLSRADVDIQLVNTDLVVQIKATGESITVQDWTADTTREIEQATFADGIVLTSADLNASDVRGDGGTVRGSRNNDRMFGSALDEDFLAKEGDDSLDGGAGTDILEGGAGNDDYLFSAGWGADTIIEQDGSAYTDTAAFGSGMSAEDLKFEYSGNDLLVTRIGSTDSVTVQDWGLDAANHVEEFRTADGSMVTDAGVEQLIQAMATFQQDHGGITWEEALNTYPDETGAILAASWQ